MQWITMHEDRGYETPELAALDIPESEIMDLTPIIHSVAGEEQPIG